MKCKSRLLFAAVVAVGLYAGAAGAEDLVLRVGQVGVMSGPGAEWGLSNKYSAKARADQINESGGWAIGDKKYRIEIVSIDDKNDPKLTVAAFKKLSEEGIKYIIGPNIDQTAAAVVPVVHQAKILNIAYAFSKDLYTAPNSNSALGMIASFQTAPAIYEYLKTQRGVKTVAFVAANDKAGLLQRDGGVLAAKELGLTVLSDSATYEMGASDFYPVITPIVQLRPDLIVLSGVASPDAAAIIRSGRELGYQGLFATEAAQDGKVLLEGAGSLANGFFSIGGMNNPEMRTPLMADFAKRYEALADGWNDEAATKVYALEQILQTISIAGEAAISDVDKFKEAIPQLKLSNPFMMGGEPSLQWIGDHYFGQKRQINVPLVITEFKDGEFQTIDIKSVD